MGSYINPTMVVSPKAHLKNLKVLYDGGEDFVSLAQFEWEGETSVGIRWNGGNSPEAKFQGMGNPQSRGVATWFVLPRELGVLIIKNIENIKGRFELGERFEDVLASAKQEFK